MHFTISGFSTTAALQPPSSRTAADISSSAKCVCALSCSLPAVMSPARFSNPSIALHRYRLVEPTSSRSKIICNA